MKSSPRPAPSAVDQLADQHVARLAGLDPIEATHMGVTGHDHELPDYSPDGHGARHDAAKAALDSLRDLDASQLDARDQVTHAAMSDRLGLELELFEAGEHLADLNVVASPIQAIRDVFDLMPTASHQDWEVIAARLAAVPAALTGYAASLAAGQRGDGPTPAARQVELGAAEARRLARPDSALARLATGASSPYPAGGLPRESRARLERAAASAGAAFDQLADFLERDLAPGAPAEDAFGRDRYALWSRYFVGAALDLDEAYAWGVEELARLTRRQQDLAAQIAGPGATVEDAVRALDADPSRQVRGKSALREWMQATADAAMAALDGTHFDIPEPVKRLEARIAPGDSGAIYYTGPSQDFARPGRMWWAVPPGVDQFATWREKTTVHHEGVPGHHLQVGVATAMAGELNDWRRLASWSSGHGEGWALYAEALMEEIGLVDEAGDLFGLVDGQRLRAARVVFDIGAHLRLPAPERFGGGLWDADKAWELLKANNSGMSEGFARFEWARYLGWGGQAPAYKLGQREWERLRALAVGAGGLSLRQFHDRALRLGSLPLAVLPTALGL
ncbi:MAG: DUF885 domain-containing protein [Bifidobacteriaceae bacterium]|jgi:uncharacterized protein (DUF885 family)|nr:DUF885 domain-containing protein [Bifidobacteriaceae bacterium]